MLRDIPWMLITIIFGVFLTVFIGFYYFVDYKQNSVNQAITKTVESAIIANADNSSRLQEGELFIDKNGFETDFEKWISQNINLDENIENIKYEYLNANNGALKAVKVRLKINDEKLYQATYKVNISEL